MDPSDKKWTEKAFYCRNMKFYNFPTYFYVFFSLGYAPPPFFQILTFKIPLVGELIKGVFWWCKIFF